MNRITWTEPAIDWAIGDKTISLGRYWCWSSIWERDVKEREGIFKKIEHDTRGKSVKQ